LTIYQPDNEKQYQQLKLHSLICAYDNDVMDSYEDILHDSLISILQEKHKKITLHCVKKRIADRAKNEAKKAWRKRLVFVDFNDFNSTEEQ